ncbi:MAG: winged helix DNA-binding domain-containing protein [Anaerolineae bacterium]|nr:winged helix DNA-binding domain-containing protein [Anaerolineae bacterium]
MLTLDAIAAHRAETYRTRQGLRVETKEEGIEHVNARGFVMFWPIKGVVMPSLWAAVAGDRVVPNEHDDPGHVTWGWKDSLLGRRRWYYGKVLRKKATIISLDVVPYFYALSENFGSPEDDYLTQYRDGTMTAEAKQIYEVLLREGPMNSPALRRATSMMDNKSNYRFNRGLTELQGDFKTLPIGVAEAGAWNYAFIHECVHRHHPEILEQARKIKIGEARQELVTLYVRSAGAVQVSDVMKVFQWPKREMERTIDVLVEAGSLVSGLEVEGQQGTWLSLPELAG